MTQRPNVWYAKILEILVTCPCIRYVILINYASKTANYVQSWTHVTLQLPQKTNCQQPWTPAPENEHENINQHFTP